MLSSLLVLKYFKIVAYLLKGHAVVHKPKAWRSEQVNSNRRVVVLDFLECSYKLQIGEISRASSFIIDSKL